jgi:4-diphosphocytidyl-2-C-methyl-D-erythritol kinase
MICFPNAKINLGLHVTGKRDDGYHNIETVFYPVPTLYDALELVSCSENAASLTVSGLETTSLNNDNNLVLKSLRLLSEHFRLPPFKIFLTKVIPVGAGLGGGSADAAFMLKLINTFCSLQLTDSELEHFAATIGADCPFFIYNKPVIATGIGNIFTPISLSLSGYFIYIVKPAVSVSTQEAYSYITPQKSGFSLSELATTPVHKWRDCLYNDFELRIFNQYTVIADIKTKLYELGAEYASMSGSGSAVYGLFRQPLSNVPVFNSCKVWGGRL